MQKVTFRSLGQHVRKPLVAMSMAVLAVATQPAGAAVLSILPIKICDDGGLNCANDSEMLYLAETNKIWAQAGITFSYLPFQSIASSEYLSLDDAGEVASLFSTAPSASVDPLVITMWFTGFHFDAYGEVSDIPGNKIVIDQVIFTEGRLDTIAHEVGHLLGLMHDDPGVGTDHLMRSGDDRTTPTVIGDITPDGAGLDKLTAAQIATALSDPKLAATAVPEPSALALTLLGFGLTGAVTRRRRSTTCNAATSSA